MIKALLIFLIFCMHVQCWDELENDCRRRGIPLPPATLSELRSSKPEASPVPAPATPLRKIQKVDDQHLSPEEKKRMQSIAEDERMKRKLSTSDQSPFQQSQPWKPSGKSASGKKK